jgi:hypothetical protein
VKEDHLMVLDALASRTVPGGEMCIPFKAIHNEMGCLGYPELPIPQIRRIVRHFARKGWAEFHFPLWTEEGRPAGAGYCISKAGLQALDEVAA